MVEAVKARSLEETPTWAVAVVCFVMILISIIIEHIIHLIGRLLTKRHKRALYEALEKIKSELMLLGFMSLLLTIGQGTISEICVPKSVGATWHPCSKQEEDPQEEYGGSDDKCAKKASDGITQLHIFIFVLAAFHVLCCIITLTLSRAKMRKWKKWEIETATSDYQFSHALALACCAASTQEFLTVKTIKWEVSEKNPERFRFARETSFGRRHLNFWTRSPILLWIVCFFRQFLTSIPKVDYQTLRHGFIIAHLAPHSQIKFDFQTYIKRSLEEDFKVVVGISPTIWFVAILFLLSNTHGYLTGEYKATDCYNPDGSEDSRHPGGAGCPGGPTRGPSLLVQQPAPTSLSYKFRSLSGISNAFQFAFFAWTWYEFGLKSCFHKYPEDLILKISMWAIVQFFCSYVTLPLYALVTQMGTTMRPTIFNERFAKALRNWHHTAKQHIKQNRRSGTVTPATSAPGTPSHTISPAASPMACRHHPDLLDLKPVAGVGNKTPVYKHRKHDGVEDREALVLTSTPTPFIQSDDFQRHIDMTDFYLIS
uniref:MLO-like protein n=1 Tax=Salix viminalis TaxID=40686 RepID=A0A6N2N7Y1_SALVM